MQYTYTGAKIMSDMHKERTFFSFIPPLLKAISARLSNTERARKTPSGRDVESKKRHKNKQGMRRY